MVELIPVRTAANVHLLKELVFSLPESLFGSVKVWRNVHYPMITVTVGAAVGAGVWVAEGLLWDGFIIILGFLPMILVGPFSFFLIQRRHQRWMAFFTGHPTYKQGGVRVDSNSVILFRKNASRMLLYWFSVYLFSYLILSVTLMFMVMVVG